MTFFNFTSDGYSSSFLSVNTTLMGEAIVNTTYPSDQKAHAFMVMIVPAVYNDKFVQGIVSNPIQLSVSRSTRLLLSVSKDNSSTQHLVEGWLVWNSSGVSSKVVSIDINGTKYSRTTDGNGYFSLTLDLQPQDNNITNYMIIASFEGDTAVNATAWAKTLDGQDYPACTTIQYGFKPSSNMTTLTVDPRVTKLMRLAKSPEEMQKEQPPNSELLIGHEFSLWFPWYRLHYVGKYGGGTMIDVGIPVFPWGETGLFPNTPLRSEISESSHKVLWGVIEGIFATELALWFASYNPVWFGIVVVGYVIYKCYKLFVLNWYSIDDLQCSLVSTFISLALSAWNGLCSFLPSVWHALAAGVLSIQNLVFKFLCRLLLIPINIYLLLQTWHRIQTFG